MKRKKALKWKFGFVLISLFIWVCDISEVDAQKPAKDSLKIMLVMFQNKITDSAILKITKEAQTLLTDTMTDTLATKLFALEESLFRTEQVPKKIILQYFLLVERLTDHPTNKNWQHTVAALNNLAFMYVSMGLYQRALHLYQQTLVIIKDASGEENSDYYSCLNNLAWLYETMALFKKSDSSYQKVLGLIIKVKGEEHADYASGLINLAGLYKDMSLYEKAVSLFQQALTILKKTSGQQSRDYAILLNNLALLYVAMGLYDKALPLYQEGLAIISSLFGEKHNDFTATLHNMAQLYENLALYEKAFPLYQQVLTIDKEALGEDNPDYANSLNDFGYLYELMGQYETALPLYQQALAIIKNALGKDNPEYATILSNQAGLLQSMGQYDQALLLYQQSTAIRKKILGEKHTDFAKSLNNLAGLYKAMGMYKKAIPLLQRALSINKTLGDNHPDYATSLNSLADLYATIGMYYRALPLYQQALSIRKNVLGDEHPDYATSLSGLANIYEKKGKYDSSLSLYQQAMSIRKKSLGQDHPEYLSNLNDVGLVYNLLKQNENAINFITRAHKGRLQNVAGYISTLSEQEKTTLLITESSKFDFLPSLLYTSKSGNANTFTQLFNSELLLKGMVLQDQQNILRTIRKSDDSVTLQAYEQWRFNKKILGKQLLLPLNKRVSYLDSLQEATAYLEQTLSRQSVAFNNLNKSQLVSEKDISQKLSLGEAAIEFTRFRLYNKKWKDSIIYAALLLLPGDSLLKFVPLFEEKQLQRLLLSRGFENVNATVAKLSRGNSTKPIAYKNDSLYLLIWKPLEKYLSGVTSVYYAPTGLLHRVAFQALKISSSNLLIDNCRLNQVLSTRSIILNEQYNIKPASAYLWGNIQYEAKRNYIKASELVPRKEPIDPVINTVQYYISKTRGNQPGSWNRLPGTIEEMLSLRNIFEEAGVDVIIDSGSVATEERFKALDGKSPALLHLATHGFFLPVNNKKTNESVGDGLNSNPFSIQQNTMFRSGLVLAGGNLVWKGNDVLPGKEDGILTAYEIAQMDLSHTDLVVLSACETALGDVQGNEGVFGLQRAFKMAGVKQLIMSLWKVPDKETKELMTAFYTNWLNGQTSREALRLAQLKMKEKYPPYNWAAFVLIE